MHAIKYPGGKHYLAARIVELFPSRETYLHYVEPFFGGGSVLFEHDPEGKSEVANDINSELMHFWEVLQDESLFWKMQRVLEATPFSEIEWKLANSGFGTDIVRKACSFFINCRQSLAGRMDSFAPLSKKRVRRGMNEQVSAWLTAIEGLPAVHARLKRVVILKRDALDVIREQDSPTTLFYLDPPYHHETRTTTTEYGQFEMDVDSHTDLLELLSCVQGKFVLSGYRCELYDYYANQYGWGRHDFELPNNAAGGKSKRRMIESVWRNYQ